MKIIAEVCLYGSPSCGYGYLAVGPAELEGGKLVASGQKMFGSGEPEKSRSATEAYWLAVVELEEAGLPRGAEVLVFAPGGERMSRVKCGGPLPYVGALKWEPAPMFELPMEEVLAAASPAMPFEKPL